MKISAKAEYACVAVLDLSLRYGQPDPVRLTDIAHPNEIPERFLVQILLQLKGAGFVTSLRGASGGYRLAVDPKEISIWDIVQTIDGPAVSHEPESSQGVAWHVLRKVWSEVNSTEAEYLQHTTFDQLVELARQQSANMYYI